VARPISVAIVGAGPAGFYAAEALLGLDRDVRIDFIERLPTPYGLIRAGVAPDHQTTKKVARKFDKTARQESVAFFGNVTVGEDISLATLREIYDAVVLAIGAPVDRYLGIPGEDLQGVYGSALMVGWYNGHPDFHDLEPMLDTTAAVVIGNGNVALDVARLLVKSARELAVTDIAEHAAQAIAGSPITDVYVVGRRRPQDARFTNVELREMGQLEACVPLVDAAELDADTATAGDDRERRLQEKNLATLREFSGNSARDKPKRVHFRFYLAPQRILGETVVEGVRFERTRLQDGRLVGTGEVETIPCGLLVAAIGYRGQPLPGVPFDAERGAVVNSDGRIEPGLYAVGWAKRGPVGVISSNRPDGLRCAEQIAQDLNGGEKPGRPALARVLAESGVRVVSFEDWQRIDAAEVAAADGSRPRRKFTTIGEMLGLLEA
jgi:NADPH-dependent glutamate synthase beta subunit-like oxidoreductase